MSTIQNESSKVTPQKIWFHAAVFLATFLILVLRRPDAVLNAQFYAEDGTRWFAEAYHFGWHCLLMPESGYLQTASRLVALLSLAFPFALAPLVMNLFALIVHIIPVNLFLMSRFNNIPLQIRVAGALLYLALPNSFEVHANTTNMQWHLALAGLLILLGQAQVSRVWRAIDLSILTLAVLDGPAGMLLAPIAVFMRWKRKDSRLNAASLTLVAGAALQILMILFSHSRRTASNGATIHRLVSILGGQVFLSSIFGVRTSIQLFFGHSQYLFLCEIVALIIGLAILLYAFHHGPIALRAFLCFAAALLFLALLRPVATTGGGFEQWEKLQIPGVGNRYYFFPMLAFYASLIWTATNTKQTAKFARFAAIAVLALLPIGIVRDWRYKPFVDYNFKAFAADFERAAPGTTVTIPINPDWQLILIKH
jgi:hypothetical protein